MAVLGTLAAGILWTPFDPYEQAFFDLRISGSSASHWLGVDRLGQDYFSRIWRGAGNSILFALLGSVAALVASAILLAAERTGGRIVGKLVRAFVSFGIAMPAIFIGLLVVTFMERGPLALTIAIGAAGVPFAFRQLRVLWGELNGTAYVEASRAIGGSVWHRFRFTIWPNLWPQLLGLWKLVFAFALLELSALTFLGLAGDPNWAELGTLLRTGQGLLLHSPAFVIWPGVALCLVLGLVRFVRN
ncbi:ABC transporter permease [Pelagicoccus sp. NFK12]|uniref:ABC transporter permease n=1 Tax=Pelagicoccus enzymogenes TaxID=2773457 RepID=A0A927IDZ2_9BACT|nr:ABC transporter permease subunit [Pelagicoccus enzymogenes]MBD5778482.1 ABC transporter permease [Pelagicoccus enzymogenes]MDQ8197157.1 ABC transporter permease subunit [Pelagicoccus enzymogenes]